MSRDLCRLALFCSLLFGVPFSTYAAEPPSPASELQAEEEWLSQAEHLSEENHYGEAIAKLDEFDVRFRGGVLENNKIGAAMLRLRVYLQQSDTTQGALPPDRAAAISQQFTRCQQLLQEHSKRAKDKADEFDLLRTQATLQQITLQYARFLVRHLDYDAGCRLLQAARQIYLDLPTPKAEQMTVRARGTDTKVEVRKALGFQSDEAVSRELVSVAMQRYELGKSEVAKQFVCQVIDEHVRQYLSDPFAGAYLGYKMDLQGKVDLDELTRVFSACRDKDDPQYVYSSLGFANRLLAAGKPELALARLKHVQEKGISTDRMPELYVALGDASYRLGALPEALRYFITAKELDREHRFGSPDFYIKKIAEEDRAAFDAIAGNSSFDRPATNPSPVGSMPSAASTTSRNTATVSHNNPPDTSVRLWGLGVLACLLVGAGAAYRRWRCRSQER